MIEKPDKPKTPDDILEMCVSILNGILGHLSQIRKLEADLIVERKLLKRITEPTQNQEVEAAKDE